MTTAPLVACRGCGEPFAPAKPWGRMCPGCFRPVRRPSAVTPRASQLRGQMSLTDTPEWVEANSPNVVPLRPRRAR
jgi:hypothetical protein